MAALKASEGHRLQPPPGRPKAAERPLGGVEAEKHFPIVREMPAGTPFGLQAGRQERSDAGVVISGFYSNAGSGVGDHFAQVVGKAFELGLVRRDPLAEDVVGEHRGDRDREAGGCHHQRFADRPGDPLD